MSRHASHPMRRAAARLLNSGRRPVPTTRLRLQDLEERAVFDVSLTASAGTLGPITYSTLKGAFDAINAGTHQGAVTIDVVSDTTETASAVLNGSGAGSAAYTSVLLRPEGGAARTISGAIAAGNPLIDLNGADNVTIDGLNSGGNALTISNTTVSPTSGTSTIRLQTDATGNTITNSSILGSSTMSTTTNGGNIWFGAGAVATGNDNNVISNNNIGPAGANLPTKLIYGNGSTTSTATYNSGVQILNNNLFDYFNAALQANAVYVAAGNANWTINNNRVYQTAARTQTTAALLAGIQMASSNNDGMVVSGNTIGFANAAGTGTTSLVGIGVGSKFIGIYFSVGGTITPASIQGNTVAGINLSGVVGGTGTSGSFVGISIASGLANIGTTAGNTIGSLTTPGSITLATNNASALEAYGIYFFPSAVSNVSNNNVGGIAASNSGAGGLSVYGLRAFTTTTVVNTFQNNTVGSAAAPITLAATAAASRLVGLYSQSGAAVVTGNTIGNLTSNAPNIGTGTLAGVIGLWVDAASATIGNNVAQNTVRNLSNTDPSVATWVTGINYSGAASGTQTVQRNLVHGLTTASTSPTATVNGINVTGGTATYQNNLIALGAGMTATSPQINGIAEVVAGIDNFYHNSVYIGGTGVAAGTGNSFAFNSTVTTNTRNYRDNIFYNARGNGAATGKHYAIRVGGTAAGPAGLTSNNNILFADGTGGHVGLFNAADRTTLGAWQTATGNDVNSFGLNPQFLAPAAATPDLHIHPTTPTVVEGTGADVGVTTDFDGQTRSALTPIDIGADGGNFVPINLPPTITYTPIGLSSQTTNRTLTVTLVDATGVAGGALAPRVYFSKNGGAYSSAPLILTAGTATNGTWTGTIDHAVLGGVASGDVVRYFVVAQDTDGLLTANPPGGFAGTDVNTVTSPPTTPSQYVIAVTYAGTYNVGSGETFTSLTQAGGLFEALNNGVLTGNVTVNITSDLAGETGAVVLNQWAEEGTTGNTLRIKPSGAARTISGTSATGLIKLNGADRVTIDGSLAGGTDRSLTINNASTAGVVIWIASASAVNGATNDTIKNTILTGAAGGATIAGVLSGSGAVLGNEAEAPNSDNTIQNNVIFRVQNSAYLRGNSTAFDQNWLVTGNTFGSAVTADKNTFRGMLFGNTKNAVVSDNTIAGVISSTASTATTTGIQVAFNLDGGTITRNRITDIKQLNTTGWGSNGIFLGAATTASNLSITNNFISDVASQGFGGTLVSDNGYGIMVNSGGGYKLYNNSVLLNTNQGANAAAGITAAINISSAITTAGSLDIRNNIFDVAQTLGTRYGVYSGATAAVFSDINYNDYFAQNVGFLTSARATLTDWQTATGKDVNSLAVDPLFVTVAAPADLHVLAGSPVIDAGTNVGVSADIDGNLRDARSDIGGDETVIPPVAGGGGSVTYTENDPATPLAPGLTLADANSPTLASATVTLAGFVAGQDVLSFTNVSGMGNIAVAGYAGGVLTLTSAGATATLAEWQAALRAVTYANTSENPSPAARTAAFVVNDGFYNSNPVSVAITVVPVNDVPVAQSSSVTTAEDTARTFAVADFGFTDAEGNALASIAVSALSLAAGDTLTVDQGAGAVAVVNGMTITAAQLSTLTYTPAADASGAARTAFAFTVNDAGPGTVSATMSIDVTAVNDAPVALASTVTTAEDTARTFAVADFGFTDAEGDSLVSITVSGLSLAAGDTLTVDQGAGAVAVVNGMTITAAQLSTLTYTPAADANGTARTTFAFTVNDAGVGTVAATMSIDVTAVNDVPVAQSSTVTTAEDTPRTFAVADFGFTDAEGNALASIAVSALSLAAGDTLTVDQGAGAVAVVNGMTITAAQLSTLTYTPAADASGAARTAFAFTVNDAGPGTVSATMSIDVTAVNDAPVALASTVTTTEDAGKTFALGDFLFADVEGDSLVSITVSGLSLATGDTLTVNLGAGAVAVTNGMTITAAQLSTLTYTPAANGNGLPRSTFAFKVNDAGPGTVAATMSINVTAVNDVPVALSSSVTTAEDTPRTFAVGDFQFTDVEGNGLASIAVGALSLATGDTLTVNLGAGAVAVASGMTITAAQLSTLTYTPAANASGTARTTFAFTVNDAGLGTVSATMSIDVTAVNDAPVALASTVATNQDETRVFALSDFLFTDVEGNGLVSITVSGLSLAAGDTLTVDQGAGPVAVADGITITAAQIPSLTYTPATGGSGLPRSTFAFTVNDADLGTVAATLSINVTQLSDIQFQSPTFTTGEDGVTVGQVVVTRSASSGPVSVTFRTADGTAIQAASGANPQDYTAVDLVVTWAAGDFAPKTIDIPVNDDTLNEGRETVLLALSSATGNARLGAARDAVLIISPSDGAVVTGSDKKPQVVLTDADGDLATVKLAGKVGTLKVFLTDTDGDGKGPIELIEVAGTDPVAGKAPTATLTVKAAKPKGGTGDGLVGIGELTGSSLKSFTATKSDLDGVGIHPTGYIGTVSVKDVKNGADIVLPAAAPTTKSKVKVVAQRVGDGSDVTVAAPTTSLTAWAFGDGAITAPSLGTLSIAGNKKAGVLGDFGGELTITTAAAAGKTALGAVKVSNSVAATATITAPSIGTVSVKKDFAGDLVVTGAGVVVGKPALKSLTVTGAVSGSMIDVAGNIGAVTVGSFRDSDLYAGYNATLGTFPVAATVGTFKVTAKVDGFVNSDLYATNFNGVTLASLTPNNGGVDFGVHADTAIKSVSVPSFGFRYPGLADRIGDFVVTII